MKITIDTSNLSELDISMLAFLAENGEVADSVDDEPEEEAPVPAPAKKTAAKKTAAKKADPEPEPEDEPEAEEADGDAPTMSDAVAAATQLVSNGKAAQVKAALETVGAKRVSEMEESDIPAFLAALESAEG